MKYITTAIFICLFISGFAQVATDVPGWFTRISKSNSKKMYAIGVSDPKMEEKDAYRLALLRAKSMLSMFRSSNVQHVVDLYESQREQGETFNSQKLEKLSKIFSKYVVDSAQIEIVQKQYNKDGEAIVLIRELIPKVDTARCKDTIKVECNSFMQEFKIDEASKSAGTYVMGALELSCKNKDSLKCYFECVDENNIDFTISTSFMDSVYTSHSTMHEYANTTDKQVDAAEFLGYSLLKKGLWKALLDAVLQNMISISNLMSFKAKNTGDGYKNDTNNNSSAKDEHLTRSISSNTLSVSIKSMEIYQNKLWLKMNTISYEKTKFQKHSEKITGTLKKSLDQLMK